MSSNTVALKELRKIKTSDVLDVNYDKLQLYKRAMHVFFVSYAGYERIGSDNTLFNTNLRDYQSLMMEMFGVTDRNAYIHDIKKSSMNGSMLVEVAIMKAIGIKKMKNPIIVVNVAQKSETINLKSKNESFWAEFIFYMKEFGELRAKNALLKIKLRSQSEHKFNVFAIGFRDIHAEGFRDWFEFSNGIKLLISVQFRYKEKYSDPLVVNQLKHFKQHIQFILHSLRNRVEKFNATNLDISNMLISYPSKKTETLKKSVDCNTQNAYWTNVATSSHPLSGKFDEYMESQSESQKQISFIGFLKSRQIIGNKSKYHDLHISSIITDEIMEESFCVCNEWCNFSAFFYYNPIIRFLLVQHHQLYCEGLTQLFFDSAVIPDTYLFVCSHLLTNSHVRTPLFQLLKSAKDYSERNYMRQLVDKNFQTHNDTLHVHRMKARAYNILRHRVNLTKVLEITSKSMFSDIVIESIRIYFEVFEYLHYRIAEERRFVALKSVREWFEEYENNSRQSFHRIVEFSTNRVMTEKHILLCEDILFNIDYNAYSSVEKDKGALEVIRWRNKVRELNANPYNVKFTCDQLLAFIIGLNKMIQRVEPILPGVNEPYEEEEEMKFAAIMDDQLNQFDMKSCKASIVKGDKRLPLEEVYYYKYYTLKCYNIGYCLQNYLVHAFTYYNEQNMNVESFATKQLHFVFRNDWIEASLKSKYREQFMFNDRKDSDLLDAVYDNFYFRFWQLGISGTSFANPIDAVVLRYAKLYFWWKVDGNRRKIFTDIVKSVNSYLESVLQTSQYIFYNDILNVYKNEQTKYEYKTEVIDLLVYWLVKADCFMFIKIAAHLLKLVHKLQDDRLVRKKLSFTQSNPGLVFLFRTYDQSIIKYIHRCKIHYIEYDDEYNRIDKVLNNTKKVIKSLYSDLYQKLCRNWIKELKHICDSNTNGGNNKMLTVIGCDTCVGAHFMYAFVDDFRKVCYQIRKYAETRIIEVNYNQSIYRQEFVKCWQLAKQWIREQQELERPLLAMCWRTHLAYAFRQFESSYNEHMFSINTSALPFGQQK